jgi:hypothetical protein
MFENNCYYKQDLGLDTCANNGLHLGEQPFTCSFCENTSELIDVDSFNSSCVLEKFQNFFSGKCISIKKNANGNTCKELINLQETPNASGADQDSTFRSRPVKSTLERTIVFRSVRCQSTVVSPPSSPSTPPLPRSSNSKTVSVCRVPRSSIRSPIVSYMDPICNSNPQ